MRVGNGTTQVIALFRVRQVCAEVRLIALVVGLIAFILACVFAARDLYWIAGWLAGVIPASAGSYFTAEYLARWAKSN